MNPRLNTLEAIRSAKEALEILLQSQPMVQAALENLEREESAFLDEGHPPPGMQSKRPQESSKNKNAA